MNLPTHGRNLPAFKDTLREACESKVIQAMNLAGDDIANQSPEHLIQLPAVGIQRHNIPVQVHDPLGSENVTTLSCDISLTTCVPAQKRGIHMSRIGDLVARLSANVYTNLQQYATHLAEELNKTQHSPSSKVKVSSIYSYLEDVAGWNPEKNKKSLEQIGLQAGAYIDKDSHIESAGITIAHLTACPCVQQTYKHALLQTQSQPNEAIDLIAPLLTHSQRSRTTIDIENLPNALSIRTLLECLDRVVFRTQNTLPREYELLLVYRSHQSPQFLEDVLRQVIFSVYSEFKSEFESSSIKIRSTSMESIHDFDLVAEFDIPFLQLKEQWEKK